MANNGREYAKMINRMNVDSLKKEMKTFWVIWDNESDEYQTEFVKTVKPDVMVYILNHSKMA